MARTKNADTPSPRYSAVVASSARVNRGRRIARHAPAAWQVEAWRLFDAMGELRFAVSWIGNSVSRVRIGAGRVELSGDVTPLTDDVEGETLSQLEIDAARVVSEIGGSPVHVPGMLQHLATVLTVAGVGWVLVEADPTAATGWKWRTLSNDEVRDSGGNGNWEVEAIIEDGPEWDDIGWRPLKPEHVLIKVWRRHPRRHDQADSPVRAVIPVLQQLEGIDGHIDATSKSRLAGAGILFSPAEVDFPPPESPETAGTDPGGVEFTNVDGFLDMLIDNAKRAIADPSDPAAVVPLPVEVPAEYIEAFKHMTFWTEYSEQVVELSDRAVRRFALGMDIPPEVVTGMGDASHWAAWRVQEEGVTIHIAPLAAIIMAALTTGWVHPTLEAMGHDPVEVSRIVAFADTSPLLVRPDKSADAAEGYKEMVVSGQAYRRESGLDEGDKPSPSEYLRRVLMRAMDRNPELSRQIIPLLAKTEITEADVLSVNWEQAEQQTFGDQARDGERSLREVTDRAGQSSPTPTRTVTSPESDQPSGGLSVAASFADPVVGPALLASLDGIAFRALERAGNRLRAAAGKGVPGGNAVVASCPPEIVHTVFDAVTFSDTSTLLAGAFDRMPEIAARFSMPEDDLTGPLHEYLREVLVSGEPHTMDRLSSWLVGR